MLKIYLDTLHLREQNYGFFFNRNLYRLLLKRIEITCKRTYMCLKTEFLGYLRNTRRDIPHLASSCNHEFTSLKCPRG